jgi:hypothetical protein
METGTSRNSQSAWALHTRLQSATRTARADNERRATPIARLRRRLTGGAPWALLETLQVSRGGLDPSLSADHALRQVLVSLIETDDTSDLPCGLEGVEGPVLIIRSGPWPVLRTLLDALAARKDELTISVLCHQRDADTLARLAEETGLELEPLFYPRFEPFVTATLRRLLAGGRWTSTLVLDASKHGRGHSLEHVTAAVTSRIRFVWNGSGKAFRQRSLRERLGREKYALVRGLLRWRASRSEGDLSRPVARSR